MILRQCAAACSSTAVPPNRFTRIYQGFIQARPDLDEIVRTNKHLIMETALASELQVLAMQLTRIAKGDPPHLRFTFNSQRSALAEIVASFPVYRTYIAGCESARRKMPATWIGR